jgi:GAF domain-containing protein/CheY-like chemotaxis protein
MAGSPTPGALKGLASAVFLAVLATSLAAQTSLSLEQVGYRQPPDYKPSFDGQEVIIRGTVNAPPNHFPLYSTLTVDDGHFGAALEVLGTDTRLDGFHPGDELEVEGKVSSVAGMIVVLPSRIAILGRKAPPFPLRVSLHDLQGYHYLGRLVQTRGPANQFGDTVSGAYMGLGALADPYRIFLPRTQEQQVPKLSGLGIGDEVEVTGVAFQYCVRPPFNRGFEMLVGDPALIVRTERRWSIPPLALAGCLAGILLTALLVWGRERRLRTQRERLRRTYQLGEEILGCSSTDVILKRVTGALPGILGITRVHLYAYNRAAKTLDAVVAEEGERASISLSSPPGGTQAGAVACFHYRTLLVIPDIDRSPFPMAGKEGEKAPKSLLFVPMMAQGEVIGVLELDQDDRAHDFTADEQSLAQHLGNQIGVAMRLLDQRSVQEQLFRTEKLAAVGRLISGVVNELQTPLACISDLATRALERGHIGPAEREISAIAGEAQRAAGMVARLVSFAAAEQGEARPVDVSSLLRTLIEFREGDWKASGIRVRDLTTREPIIVLGSQGQLEQVFLNLLVHAEQSLADAPQKVITVRASVLARRLLVEIAFSAPPDASKPEETAAVLGVTRSVVAGHGGEVRLIEKGNAEPRFEVELPATQSKDRAASPAPTAPLAARESSRNMTALVIEPEEAAQRQILGLLATRGYRVVPVSNSDTGLELAQRMRFDAAFCSVHAPGLNWVELSERLQSRVGAFILISDGYDAELSADFEGENRFVLPKPVQEAELARVLKTVEQVPHAKVIPMRNVGS